MTHGSGPTCGNCGKSVSATDVICPHCDALLAAYQSPGGSTIGTATATTPVIESASPAAEPLRSATMSTSPAVSEAYAPPPITPTPAPSMPTAPIRPAPSPLRGDSDLAAAASQSTSEIADELTEMARVDSSFAKSVEAQAKRAIVESESVASVKPEPASKPPSKPDRRRAPTEPVRTVRGPRTSNRAAVTTQEWTNTADQLGENPDPNRTLNPPVPPRSGSLVKTADISESESTNQPPSKTLASQKNAVAVVAFVVIVAVVFRSPGAFFFLALAIGLVFVFFRTAIKATKSNSRPTTRMPYDKQNRRKRDR